MFNAGGEKKLTPMMEQWQSAKRQHPDAILLFRMGDFYELFDQDATIAAPILDLNLTSRNKEKSSYKMAGFPFHAADSYIAKLVEYGHKVAICEQLEDPKLSRGVVKRGITNVLTPGTAIVEEDSYNGLTFLVSIASENEEIALCGLDLSTATFQITSSKSEKIIDELIRLAPRELLLLGNDIYAQEIYQKATRIFYGAKSLRMEKRDPQSLQSLKQSFLQQSNNVAKNKALLLILSYLKELKGSLPSHVGAPQHYSIDDQLLMDEATRINLDLLPKKKSDTNNLFSVLNKTKTAMGKRALYQAIIAPSTDKKEIENRHQMVEELLGQVLIRNQLQAILAGIYDMEKLTALASSYRFGPRAMAHLRDCLQRIEEIRHLIKDSPLKLAKDLAVSMPDLSSLNRILTNALTDTPPVNLKDGGVFQTGYDKDLDQLLDLINNGKHKLLELEKREKEKTGIPSLKVKYTRVFGYYIEVTKTHLDKVPQHYLRKQTIANGERYVTEELNELESKMNSAEEKALEIEEQRFLELRQLIIKDGKDLIKLGRKIAYLDLITSFAELAAASSLVKPEIVNKDDRVIEINGGRHPIVEDICLKDGSYFVPNDMILNKDTCLLMLLTGPNMAGKSTIMRQVGLIQIMAQIGSFVPASSAKMSICDAIFARVGASDDLATGRSTFMVEMTETASILNNASIYSLILLDEIGRGTSTYDGLSIAQAVAEYIHDQLQTRTIFATHYHELTSLEKRLNYFFNYHVEIDEKSSDIKFLYTLKAGPCLKSFGIEVAKLSGLPQPVLKRAKDILYDLEAREPMSNLVGKTVETSKINMPQLNLFGVEKKIGLEQQSIYMDVIKKIVAININHLTPLKALNKLAAWQNNIRSITLK
jgi:DNA mismatch repair protein MutS